MVENSLGRLWLEGHPNETLKAGWKYYLDEAEQEPAVQEQLAKIRAGYATIKPEDIRVIDPCMGSGHILVYMFDVLVQIYENYGYTTREAVESIIQHNLYGLDIDDRAAQLAYFAVMMKARQYDRRFLSRKDEDGTPNIPQPHVYAIVESNGIDRNVIKQLGAGMPGIEYNNAVAQMNALLDALHDAKEYGSILMVDELDWDLLRRFVTAGVETDQISVYSLDTFTVVPRLYELIDVGEALGQKYDAVVTNPPYMGASGMGDKLGKFVKENYPDSKSDMSTVCMERTLDMCKQTGFMAMINIPVWMFLSSYEKLRGNMIRQNTFVNMVHPGRGIFGSDFGTTTFVIAKQYIPGYRGSYRRLFKKQGEVESIEERERAFFTKEGCFTAQQDNFSKIPGAPVAYWVSDVTFQAFAQCLLRDVAETKQGFKTGDNERFLRFWYEVSQMNSSFVGPAQVMWFPCTKGGDFRRWYGNKDYVVNWKDDGYEIKNFYDERGKLRSRPQNLQVNFSPAISWSSISSSSIHFRIYDSTMMYESKGPVLRSDVDLSYILGYTNSIVYQYFIDIIAPTLDYSEGAVVKIPYPQEKMIDEVSCIASKCVDICRTDWDSFETSWDFQQHPLVRWISTPDATSLGAAMMHFYGYHPEVSCRLELAWLLWQGECEERFKKLKANEEELNRIFIDIYGLQDELTPDVDDKNVTVRRADLGRDIRSLISYAVGVMFGRYSLNKPGLVLAGQPYSDKYVYSDIPYAGTSGCSEQECYLRDGEQLTKCYYAPDRDNVLPICDDEYFEDDIVGKFVKFIEFVYGEEDLEANLAFIANALGGKGTPREVIRGYFLNDFYKDHLKIYQKRPIYWLFDSGKKNGFKCLIYMHRYAPDTIARIRTDYVHEQQSRYRTALSTLEGQIAGASGSERVRLTKQQQKLQAQAEEIRLYEEKIHHLADQMITIDLDDGVKHNYEIFKAVLAPIK